MLTLAGAASLVDFGDAWFTTHCWPKVAIGDSTWNSA
jgi:hypothetical protein